MINNKAKDILLKAKNVDAEEMQKRIITIEKQKIEYDATGFGVQQILDGKNPLIGEPIKGTTDQKVLNATDNYLFGVAEKNKLNFIGIRKVPFNKKILGDIAKRSCPQILQFFFCSLNI